ncbi:helix-turn-helix transcriptional regulator [Saccharopolyspora taberi]|uniref:Helix-turn-helix transcriptional regulator n=2 Tax=Saccharopolyspora taberi TaxID=60895 RepID=A0ABN3VCS8_9PSEU
MLRRRVLAAELKAMRRAAGLTHVEVARRLGWQQGKVSKIESAKQGVGIDAVIALAETCNAEPEHRERLVGLARDARARGWWESYADVLPPARRTYVGLEADADVIRGFAAEVVPDLFQTRDYASSAAGWAEQEPGSGFERRLELLLRRQEQLLERHPAEFDIVLSESALRRAAGAPEQLRHLVDLAQRPDVTIRVLPFSVGAVPVESSFSLLEFRRNPHPDLVFVSGRTDCAYFEDEADVASYRETLVRLEEMAMSPYDSVEFIEEVL